MPTFDPAQPITVAVLEDGVITRLSALIPPAAASVDAFPDNPEEYVAKHQIGELLVSYADARHELTDTGHAVTTRTIAIEVAIVARGLNRKGHRHATSLVDAVRLAIAGFVVPGFEQLIPVREAFVARAQGCWIYAMRFTTSTVSVPQFDDEALGPLLELITLDHPDYGQEIPAP